MAEKRIDRFKGEYEFLSNFFVEKHGKSVEHFFQAAKALSTDQYAWIFSADTPGEAKRRGRRTTIRPDWDHIKVRIMRALLKKKFEDPELRQKLLDTGDKELVEGNNWGDQFWGVCKGHGDNMLGRLLMELRGEIRDESNKRAQK
jgi:ribA/ribD-fused uncharacterized protein